MSNFMHKVKDAMTDPHDKDTRGWRASNRDQTGSSNPSTMDQGANQYSSSGMDPSSGGRPTTQDSGPRFGQETGGQRDTRFDDTRNRGDSSNTGVDDSARAGSDPYGTINAGPHESKTANKLDPRVDSDLDNRARNTRATGSQNPNYAAQTGQRGMGTGQRGMGTDEHASSEDNFSSSKQEHKTHAQPDPAGLDNQSSEDKFSSSTQEHKSHSSQKHTEPCDMNPQAEAGLEGRTGQPQFGGGATGGSSYHDPSAGAREPSAPQKSERLNKLDPRGVNRADEQQNVGNQRGGY
ncbi:uncharacterized protein N7482_004735 [Penicillium canariense]|uniref:Uncharacterized protein n=1 Tax=Penicillium canariense TaxID=189055 RepID=A0A9W9I9I4_9EURO|nr:uncharacterized protein N7482_004735 [Penicillium canariense]KAJ5169141.1 hypothetical protein N7482_004735 [Penicillium canariense]